MSRCDHWTRWQDCDIDMQCVLDQGHAGWHRDGARWWNNHGFHVPNELETRPPDKHN